MSRKTAKAGRKASAATGQTPSSKTRPKISKKTQTAAAKGRAKPAKTSPGRKTPTAAKTATTKVVASSKKKGPVEKRKRATAKAVAPPAAVKAASAEVLAKAEADIRSAVESLNTQFGAAMETLTALAVAQRGPTEAVLETAPLDRATAMFQRLVTDMLDEQLSSVLPTLVALRGEMSQRLLSANSGDDAPDDDFYERGTEMLDQVLAGAHVARYDVQPGDEFDPLIHLAIGEDHRAELPDGAVAESLQPGFRTTYGKVIAQAKVKVNRR
jgi:molecular chaperone GrpE (heat shock protein)